MSSRESVRNRFASRAFLALVALMFAALANAQGAFTLTTPQTQNNGQAGVCFTIEAFNTIKIWRLGANMDGGSIPLAIYYKQGAHAVASSAPANTGWTLAGTATATMATNANTQIPIDIDLIIPQGETYSFAIVDTASTRMNYTTGGTGQTADANIEINGQGWGLSSGSPFNASFFPRGYNGAVYYDFAGTKWTGDNSTDWNDAGNWDNGEVPDLEDGVIIPDAATTANDCHLPATAECKGFKIEAGGILVGNSGLVDMYGDWVNEGGTFVPGTSVISYVSDDVQKITTGMSTVGNIHIKNTMAEIEVTDSWEASQTGSLTADANTEMVFLSTTLNFSNTTISNQGVFKFGLTAGGVSNTLQEITGSPTVNFGVVEVNVADALDSVSFLSGVKFDDLKVMGAGNVTFNNTLEISTRFETTMDGTLQVLGAWTGDADL
ncbi:MAG: hypothetical protein KDB07_00540, partial [Planctomycetes bacterium]|nr:hypothetical protein [Planctomycetota bacterium]